MLDAEYTEKIKEMQKWACSSLANTVTSLPTSPKIGEGEELKHDEQNTIICALLSTSLQNPAPEIKGLVAGTSLSSLVTCSLDIGDGRFMSPFAKRWHKKTNSFHLPIGNISIILDDMTSLLHLPIIGAFHTYDTINVY